MAATKIHAEFLLDRRKQHGDEAPIHAAMHAGAILEKSDMDGAAVWRRIVKAIDELQRQEPGPGERRH